MRTQKELNDSILRMDGKGYPNYKSLKGAWQMEDYILDIRHIQSDPFASPSRLEVRIPKAGFPLELLDTEYKKIAAEDDILREISRFLIRCSLKQARSISFSRPVSQVLKRTAVSLDASTGALTVRFHMSFPAAGRRILGREMLGCLKALNELIQATGFYDHWTEAMKKGLDRAVELSMEQHAIREALKEKNAVAFVANGAILPRSSGISDLPMSGATPFVSPESLETVLDLPSGKTIEGMLIPSGITVIAGGGYHGKSTLLEALQEGVYNHHDQDGREYVITRDDAFKVRAEDGRSILNEDISYFISSLPNGRSTTDFTSLDASGSTSQAASVLESIDSGSTVLLMDEDTSATNFMVRDALMAQVVAQDEEPIIPFVSRMKALHDLQGVSTILVAGSSGAFFEDADRILQMKDYKLHDITKLAKDMASQVEFGHSPHYDEALQETKRTAHPHLSDERRPVKVKVPNMDTILINREAIDVRALEQAADREQLQAIGRMLAYADLNLMDGKRSLKEIEQILAEKLDRDGLESFGSADMSKPRMQDVMAAMNRWRNMKTEQVKEN